MKKSKAKVYKSKNKVKPSTKSLEDTLVSYANYIYSNVLDVIHWDTKPNLSRENGILTLELTCKSNQKLTVELLDASVYHIKLDGVLMDNLMLIDETAMRLINILSDGELCKDYIHSPDLYDPTLNNSSN